MDMKEVDSFPLMGSQAYFSERSDSSAVHICPMSIHRFSLSLRHSLILYISDPITDYAPPSNYNKYENSV